MVQHPLLDRLRSFPDFTDIPEEEAAAFCREVQLNSVRAQEILAEEGSPCRHFLILLSGDARIYSMGIDGREMSLFHIGPGEGCVIAATCCIGGEPLPASVMIQSSGEGLFIPALIFRAWVDNYSFWRDYVFKLIARQVSQVMAITSELAFQRLDARVASLLVRQSCASKRLEVTHQSVARELGTHRVVVSRILKGFEDEGLVALERGTIHLRNPSALTKRAGLSEFGNLSS